MSEEIRVRKEIVDRCKAEMLGPGSEDIGGDIEREVISDSPRERYSAGILFPQNSFFETDEGEKSIKTDFTNDDSSFVEEDITRYETKQVVELENQNLYEIE